MEKRSRLTYLFSILIMAQIMSHPSMFIIIYNRRSAERDSSSSRSTYWNKAIIPGKYYNNCAVLMRFIINYLSLTLNTAVTIVTNKLQLRKSLQSQLLAHS